MQRYAMFGNAMFGMQCVMQCLAIADHVLCVSMNYMFFRGTCFVGIYIIVDCETCHNKQQSFF